MGKSGGCECVRARARMHAKKKKEYILLSNSQRIKMFKKSIKKSTRR